MSQDLSMFKNKDAFKTGDMNVIVENARDLFAKQSLVKKLEAQLEEAKKDLNNFSTKVVPAACANESSMKKFELGDGSYLLEVKPFVTATIPSELKINKEKDPEEKEKLFDLRQECFKWLEEHGPSIIKNKLIFTLPKGELGQSVIQEILLRIKSFEGENSDKLNFELNELRLKNIREKRISKDKSLSEMIESGSDLKPDKTREKLLTQISDLLSQENAIVESPSGCHFPIMDNFNVEHKEDVHFQNLLSFFKDFLGVTTENPKGNSGVEVPYEIFNIDFGEKATVKEVKQKGKNKAVNKN